MITVESTEKEIHVTIPRGEMDPAQIEAILRPFRFTSLVAGSAMSQGEAMRLAEESQAGWWEKNQQRDPREVQRRQAVGISLLRPSAVRITCGTNGDW